MLRTLHAQLIVLPRTEQNYDITLHPKNLFLSLEVIFAFNKFFASLNISSSDCGPLRGNWPEKRTFSGISENRSSIDLKPLFSTFHLLMFGSWSMYYPFQNEV